MGAYQLPLTYKKPDLFPFPHLPSVFLPQEVCWSGKITQP